MYLRHMEDHAADFREAIADSINVIFGSVRLENGVGRSLEARGLIPLISKS